MFKVESLKKLIILIIFLTICFNIILIDCRCHFEYLIDNAESCEEIREKYNITKKLFNYLNPKINCQEIQVRSLKFKK